MLRKIGLTLVVCLLVAVGAMAQEQSGSIQGLVKDSSGAVLPGAVVEARREGTAAVTQVTDATGAYRFLALPPGVYTVTVSMDGFGASSQPDVRLTLGQTLRVDVALAVAGQVERVQVVGESPLIDVRSNAAASSVSVDLIDRMPKGRDFTSVATTMPGSNDETRSGGIQMDGASGSENRFLIDGMDTTALRTGVSNKTMQTDFLQEVQVKQSGFGAEYGGATGGVISAITKSGTNNFRGMGGAYYRNDDLRGAPRSFYRINPSDNVTKELVRNRDDNFANWNPIGDLGGPLRKDRLWFYAGYSYDRTDTQRNATFRNSPRPFVTRQFETLSYDNYANWNITSQLNNSMRVRFSGSNQRGKQRGTMPTLQPDGSVYADGSPTDGFTNDTYDADLAASRDRWDNTGSDTFNDLYSANVDVVIKPTLFLNVNTGMLRYGTSNPAAFSGTEIRHLFGASNVCSGTPGGANCPFPEIPADLQFPNAYVDNKSTARTVKDNYSRMFVNANTTWIAQAKGEHQVKLGFRFERMANDVNLGAQQPTIDFRWNQTLTTLDNRNVRGKYGYYIVSKGVVTQGDISSKNWSFWIQDSWSIANRLTINAGVRTENEHVPTYQEENPGIEFGFGDKIAPRLGFSYDLKGDGKWKTYGSYARYFDITKLEMPRGAFGGDRWVQYFWSLDTFDWRSINCQEGATGCPGTYYQQNDRRHASNSTDPRLTDFFGEARNTIDPNLKPVQTGEITLGLDHELTPTMSVGVRWAHKWLDRTIEDSGVVVPSVGEVFFIANPGYGVAEQILPLPAPKLPKAKRDYDGVEFRLMKRMSNRWYLNTSYLWSRLYGNYAGLASSDENGRTSPNVERMYDAQYMLFQANGQEALGRLATDRPHQFKALLSYDTPWGTTIGVNQIAQSGVPLTTTVGWGGSNNYPVYVNNRGDLGRTDAMTQTDLFLQHDFRLFGGHRLNLNMNIDNIFDQKTIMLVSMAPYRDPLSGTDALFFNGFDVAQRVADLRAAGATIRDNPLFGLPNSVTGGANSFQGRRAVRLGFKYTF